MEMPRPSFIIVVSLVLYILLSIIIAHLIDSNLNNNNITKNSKNNNYITNNNNVISIMSNEYSALKEKWEAAGQGHVFRFYDQLNDEQKAHLLSQVKDYDPEVVNALFHDNVVVPKQRQGTVVEDVVQPFPQEQVSSVDSFTAEETARYTDVGLREIANGHVAALLLAGGQGTRLGSKDPKGMYDFGIVSKRTAYQYQAERIVRLQQLARKFKDDGSVVIPWYIMTSAATAQPTVSYFEKNDFFGLKRENVFFFQQGLLPCFDLDGKVILKSPSELALSPDGNGGVYNAMKKSGAVQDMKERGVKQIMCYSVDNMLVRVADPIFVGLFHEKGAQCGAKVCCKTDPAEAVGVYAVRNGAPSVVEYTEIGVERSEARDAEGRLSYRQGNIAILWYSLDFIESLFEVEIPKASADTTSRTRVEGEVALPYHIARKKIPYANEEGVTVTPTTPNGMKFEMFVFDVFPVAGIEKMVVLEVNRNEEFSPMKNAPGSARDSPDTCRRDISAYWRRVVRENGGTFEFVDASGTTAVLTAEKEAELLAQDGFKVDTLMFCVSPLVSYRGEDIKKVVAGKTYTLPTFI
eukprot:TRINITY_DN1754_c2_g1_i1.p1 TRINITY_DN1754_c2_g1~~TRINITY_DN1754_c2_g1_i1.p1  ORF type:complete len:578 (+),score=156.06 TRINITY_DN1754_c2_g1_i1:301-2034(+)